MTIRQVLFSFRGRINRALWWAVLFGMIGVIVVIVMAGFVALFAWGPQSTSPLITTPEIITPESITPKSIIPQSIIPQRISPYVYVILGAICIPLLWIGLAVGAKRLHDRNKSAWWLLLFYVLPAILINIPVTLLLLIGWALAVWAFIEFGFLWGTAGPNRFGPDPVQRPEVAATTA
jgi:uncharacterized membrane protein YhaH (DUF805 family)